MNIFQPHPRPATAQMTSRSYFTKAWGSSPFLSSMILFGLAITAFHTFLFAAELAHLSHGSICYQFLGTARQASSDSAWALVGKAIIFDDDPIGSIGILPQQGQATDVGPASASGFLAFASPGWMPSSEIFLLLLLGWTGLVIPAIAALFQSIVQRQWVWLFVIVSSFLAFVFIGPRSSGTYTPDQAISLVQALLLNTVTFSTGPLLFALFAHRGEKARHAGNSAHGMNRKKTGRRSRK